MDTIICPHCDYEHEPTGCYETDSGEQECEKCNKEFDVFIEYNPSYSTSKIEVSEE